MCETINQLLGDKVQTIKQLFEHHAKKSISKIIWPLSQKLTVK